jgi:hypothetical protein
VAYYLVLPDGQELGPASVKQWNSLNEYGIVDLNDGSKLRDGTTGEILTPADLPGLGAPDDDPLSPEFFVKLENGERRGPYTVDGVNKAWSESRIRVVSTTVLEEAITGREFVADAL